MITSIIIQSTRRSTLESHFLAVCIQFDLRLLSKLDLEL